MIAKPRISAEDRAIGRMVQQEVTVLPGGRVELVGPELEAGRTVDRVVLHEPARARGLVGQAINDIPRERLFKTAKEVDHRIAEDPASRDR